MDRNTFDWPEYVVFGSVLGLSAGIGVFYGCCGSKQNSNEEFLMGNRNLNPLPAVFALSFLSAITLLGTPAEVYFYGTQYFLVLFSYIPTTLALTYFYVPVYFQLQLTSAYEYLELRFNRTVRIVISTVSILYLIIYMSIVVYGPSLALSHVTGINHRISVASIFIVCIFYSTLGGIKSVVTTDSIQCLIMVVSTLIVVSKGISDTGGLSNVWEKALNGSRIEFLNFDFDPRTRYTVWGSVVGECFGWLAVYAATQSNIQRFVSISSISGVRRALLYNLIGLVLLVGLSLSAGLVIYAKYYDCDPVSSKQIESSDQLLPLFVMDTLKGTPGLPGLFVAGITCASLSSVSSGLNALAAIISEDFIKYYRPNLSDYTMANASKTICVVTGIISYAFTFAAELTGSIYPTATSLMGCTLGPTLGIFTLGMFIPFANSKGSLMGLVAGISLSLFLSIGSMLVEEDLPNQKLPLNTDGCTNFTAEDQHTNQIDQETNFLTTILSISYLWISLIGSCTVMLVGSISSCYFRFIPNSIDRRCISPPILKFWEKFFPEKLKFYLKEDTKK